MELLSPVGNKETLYSAIMGGSDAVYIGMKDFGARKYANNFTRKEIKEAVDICHLYGVKVYITLNTLIKDDEVSSFLDLADYLYTIGVDAFIMQDFGMMNLILEMYPDMEIHASTQFNNSSLETIRLLKDIGIKRVVLSREMPLTDIKRIDVAIEKEVFIHGALCISYSGNCLFSSMLGNRSGNRGECTGCCRLPYKLYKNDTFIKEGYLLSTKELNTAPKFNELMNADITSFKIEGRMKSKEYVYFVTKMYSNILNKKGYSKKDLDILKILYNREFTLGHLFSDDIMNTKSSNHLGLKVGKVIGITKDKLKVKLDYPLHQEDGVRFSKNKCGMTLNFLYDEKGLLTSKIENIGYLKNSIHLKKLDDIYLTSSKTLSKKIEEISPRKVPIKLYFYGKVGDKALLKLSDSEREISVYGTLVEEAKSSPLTKEAILQKLLKIKDTVYKVTESDIEIDDNIFIPVSSINEMRQKAIGLLNKERCSIKRLGKRKILFPKLDIEVTNDNTTVVESEEELLKVFSYKRIYTANLLLFNKYKDKINIYYIEKRNLFIRKNRSKSLVSEYSYPNHSIADYSMNVTNIYSVYYLLKLGFTCVTLSVELTDDEINNLIENFYDTFGFYPNVEVVCCDKIELMRIKGNVLNIDEEIGYYLLDNKKRKFDVLFDGEFTHVFNYEVTTRGNIKKCNKRYNFKYFN